MRMLITKIVSLSVALAITMGIVSAVPALAQAQPETPAQQACSALRLQDSSVDCTKSSSITDSKPVNNLAMTVINIFSVIVGAVSVFMIIIGGFRYIISGGDSSGTKAGKDTILYAVIGLVIVIFAQVIVKFVLSETTKSATPPKKSSSIVAPIS